VQLLAEERNKNRVLRETLDTRERTIVELQTRINELMKVSDSCLFLLVQSSHNGQYSDVSFVAITKQLPCSYRQRSFDTVFKV